MITLSGKPAKDLPLGKSLCSSCYGSAYSFYKQQQKLKSKARVRNPERNKRRRAADEPADEEPASTAGPARYIRVPFSAASEKTQLARVRAIAAAATAAVKAAAAEQGAREATLFSLTVMVDGVVFHVTDDNPAAEAYQADKVARTARVVDENNVARGTRGAYAKLAKVQKQLPRRAHIVAQLVWARLPRGEAGLAGSH